MTDATLAAIAKLGQRMTLLEEQVHEQGKAVKAQSGAIANLSGKVSLVAIDQGEQMDAVITTLERICNHLGVQSAMKSRGRRHVQPSQDSDAPTAE